MVKIVVCRSCAWSKRKIRRALRDLGAAHPGGVRLVKKDCLDACEREPAVRIGGKLLAPASPRTVRRRVRKRLRRDEEPTR